MVLRLSHPWRHLTPLLTSPAVSRCGPVVPVGCVPDLLALAWRRAQHGVRRYAQLIRIFFIFIF